MPKYMEKKVKKNQIQSNIRFIFWQRWIVFYSVIGILFGIVMVFGSTSIIFKMYNSTVSEAFWGQSYLPDALSAYHPWIFAVLGSTITGWSVCFLFLALYPFKRRERWTYYCLLISLLSWVSLDSAFSLYFGINFEVFFNFAALSGFAIPLIATYRDFFPKTKECLR